MVTVFNSGAAKDRQLARMLHCFFLQAKFKFHLRACHIPGTDNQVVDALSHNQVALFFSYNSQVDSEATLVPLEWPALLLNPEVVWTSQHWTSWFESICRMPWLPQPKHSYASAQHCYLTFCQAAKINLFPCSEHGLCQFVA